MHKLVVTEGQMKGRAFDLDEDIVFIGRSSKNHIQILDGAISRQQLKISRINQKVYVQDLKSTNGTLVNGRTIPPGMDVEIGEQDIISVANTAFRLSEASYGKSLGLTVYHRENDEPLKERRSRSSKNLELVSKVSDLLTKPLKIREMFDGILELLMENLPRIDRAAILLYDQNRGQMKEVISRSRTDLRAFTYSRKVVEQVLRDGKPACLPNMADENASGLHESISTIRIESVMCVPMISNSNTLGAIYLDSIRGPHGFREEDLLLIKGVAGTIAVSLEKSALASRLEKTLSEIKIII